MPDVNDGDAARNEGEEQKEEHIELDTDGNAHETEQPAEQEQPTEPPAPKRKPRGRPPPREGEKEPLRPRLRDKTTCPDCNKQISMHALHYTHSKVCAAKKKQELVVEEVGAPNTKPKVKAATKLEVAKVSEPLDVLRECAEVSGTQQPVAQPDKGAVVMEYIRELKHKQLQEKQQRYKTLISGHI
jgi:hypothetical protein